MDSASDEINLFLPLFFGLIVFFILAIGGLIYWLFWRFKVIEFSDNFYIIRVLKDAFLSFVGVFVLVAIVSFVVSILNFVISFFKK